MDFSAWDWAASFRLHEAACLIAGVMPVSKRSPTSEDLPPQARPILVKLAAAYYEWLLQQNNPDRPKGIFLEGHLNDDGSLPSFPALKDVNGQLVSREAIHRFISEMRRKSAYGFGPIDRTPMLAVATPPAPTEPTAAPVEADSAAPTGKVWTEERKAQMTQMLERLQDPAYQQAVQVAEEVSRRLEKATAHKLEWERTDDRGIPSEKDIRDAKIRAATDEAESATRAHSEARGDYLEPCPASPATTPSPAPVAANSAGNAVAKGRRDLLVPVVETAQRKCENPFDAPAVWAELVCMAHAGTCPLLGATDEGIKWQDANDETQFFTLKNLRDRLRRSKKSAVERVKTR